MNNPSRDQIRRRVGLALGRLDGLRITPSERRLTPIRVSAANAARSTRRQIRPVRPWERLVRI